MNLRARPSPTTCHDYVRLMERAMIAALADHGVEAGLIDGLTGVWVGAEPPPAGDARKIGSIGIHVRKGITTHGLAINVNNDLQPFEWVVPCGIEACRMTSLTRELGAEQSIGRVRRHAGRAARRGLRARAGRGLGGRRPRVTNVERMSVEQQPATSSASPAGVPGSASTSPARAPTPAARPASRGGRSASASRRG